MFLSGKFYFAMAGTMFVTLLNISQEAAHAGNDTSLWYLVKSRGTPFVLLLAAAGTRYRKTAVMLTVVWLGFCFGMVICMAIIKLGSKGIVLIVTALAPQGIFYAMAGIVLFRYMLEYPMVRWDAGRSIRLGLFLMLGIITECYVNPVLTGLFLKTL